jgi:hypothetical protein
MHKLFLGQRAIMYMACQHACAKEEHHEGKLIKNMMAANEIIGKTIR